MNIEEFLKRPPHPVRICNCGCGEPLETNDPLGTKLMEIEGKWMRVNADCYFEKFSDFIDDHPIGGLGIHGPKNSGPID